MKLGEYVSCSFVAGPGLLTVECYKMAVEGGWIYHSVKSHFTVFVPDADAEHVLLLKSERELKVEGENAHKDAMNAM